jgi:nanoRNase/pAp phosphatase (c-di-AMP/oligoRNAs hydrolase)
MAVVGVVDTLRDALPSSASTEVLAVAAIVLVLVLAGVGIALYRFLQTTPAEEFAGVLGSLDSVGVLMHAEPDPDAMASALAVMELAADRDTDATAYYPGQIRRHENRAFETVLDVAFENVENAGDIEEDHVVLVDHNEPRELPGSGALDPVAVVDHHPGDGTGSRFTDVRTETGACATILTEYFQTLGWTPANGDGQTLSADIATGLVYGIHADTKFLTKGCTESDFEAVRYLFPGIDAETHERIASPPMDSEALDIKARAITDRDVRPPFAVSDVGTVSNSDAIPQAADELKRLESISAVVVMGDKDDTIRLAGRSNDDRVHMGKALSEAVEEISMSSAGGHARMGGGQIPIEYMEGLGASDGMTREELTERLFDAMNGEL